MGLERPHGPRESNAPDEGLIVGFSAAFTISVLAFLWCFFAASYGDIGHVSTATILVGLASVPVAGVSGVVLLLFAVAAVRTRR